MISIVCIVTAIIAGSAWLAGGKALVWSSSVEAGKTLLAIIPMIVIGFLITWPVKKFISNDMITKRLGSEVGWRGIATACLAGAFFPGGPYLYYPLAGILLQSGAGLGVLVSFVAAKNLWSLARLPLEFGFMGYHLTLIRFSLTLVLPPIMGIIAEFFFGKHISSIRLKGRSSPCEILLHS
ncbi:MAG: permease [Proteobacteria bacterium]|nr:permease [Pseudomonadota bacterium]